MTVENARRRRDANAKKARRVALQIRFPRGQDTSHNTSGGQAENNGDNANTNFSGNGDGGRREVNRMLDVEC